MKPTILRLITSFVVIVQLYSCDRRECSTDNPIFVENEVSSVAYQNEVARQIESIGTENLRFWLANYLVQDDQPYFI
ncbi:MAG: hypothetical protein JJ936_04505, partial [Psychroserpens sp.]|nr:hypothetical protein [Psychroserpens sp.]